MAGVEHPVRRREIGPKRGLFGRRGDRDRQNLPRKGRHVQTKAFEPTSFGGSFHGRSLSRAWHRFRSGSLSHWTTTTIIALSLTIYGTFVLFLSNADTLIQRWEGDNLVTVFMGKQASIDQLEHVRQVILQRPGIQNVTMVTPLEAMGRMKTMLGSEAGLLDSLEENPLPYSLEFQVKGNNFEQTANLAHEIRSWPGIEAVSFDHEWAKKLTALVRAIQYTGMSLLFLLLFAVALIISNTIKLTIIARRDEVEVMRFMGATYAFIKTPFIYEGILQGLLGAVGAILLTSILFGGAQEVAVKLANAFGFHVVLHFLSLGQLSQLIFFGVGLGLIGALISLSRFLEV